jgi:hypothetical protein
MDQPVQETLSEKNPDEADKQVPETIPAPPLSSLAKVLISSLQKKEEHRGGKTISVNPVVAKFATWFEKLRNVMEYREEEVMLRAAIERILRRMLLLGGNAKTTALPLVRELLWARYLPENDVPESIVAVVERSIELHLKLRLLVLQRHKISDNNLNELIYQMMSSDIAHILQPHSEKDTISNFMFQVLKDDIVIVDDSEQTRDVQIYIAIRKAFANDDLAFLRSHIMQLYFGRLSEQTINAIADNFMQGYQELLKELHYPRKERIFSFIKKRTAVFLILEELLNSNKKNLVNILTNQIALERAVYNACDEKYQTTSRKVRTAIIRSVFFLLTTKVILAFVVERGLETFFYNRVDNISLVINIAVPPLLMLVVALFMRTPGPDNSLRILDTIKDLLYSEKPQIGEPLTIKKRAEKPGFIFSTLWLLAFFISFGAVIFLLFRLHFNNVSIAVFLFFLAIVSFLSYRISLIAHLYRMGERQSLITPFVDFFFMPVIRVGRDLTENISKLNVFLFVMDFFIEAPFKLLFAFFEQWFVFLHAKRDELE